MNINRMLLLKAWLETRVRLLFPLGMFLLVALIWHSAPELRARGIGGPARRSPFEGAMYTMPVFLMMPLAFLAGNGIRTQNSFRPTPGMHGSTYYTLSLPVSRSRLLTVRATLGYIEAVAIVGLMCFAMPWLIPGSPALSLDFARYWLVIVVCGSAYYSLSVLLSTFLEDLWHVQMGTVSLFVSAWLFNNHHVPDSLNLYYAIGLGSPLFTHAMAWGPMGLSLAVAVILLAVSLKLVQAAEY